MTHPILAHHLKCLLVLKTQLEVTKDVGEGMEGSEAEEQGIEVMAQQEYASGPGVVVAKIME